MGKDIPALRLYDAEIMDDTFGGKKEVLKVLVVAETVQEAVRLLSEDHINYRILSVKESIYSFVCGVEVKQSRTCMVDCQRGESVRQD